MAVNRDTEPLITRDGEDEGRHLLPPPQQRTHPAAQTVSSSSEGLPLLPSPTYPALRRRYWKNLLVLSFSVLLVFISFVSLQNLESSINSSQGLGVMSLGTLYASLAVGCLFSPLVVDRIGAKASVLVMFCSQIAFAGVNFYARYWTLVPVSGLVGFTSAFFWTGVGSYILQAATGYATLVGESVDKILNTFTGVFVGIWQSSQVVGNLVSSLVLHKNSTEPHSGVPGVQEEEGEEEEWSWFQAGNSSVKQLTCGAEFCNFGKNDSHQVSRATPPAHDILSILLGAYLGCCLLGTLLAMFALDKKPGGEGVNVMRGVPREEVSSWSKVFATLQQHKDTRLQLLIPLFMYNGLSQGFIFSDYTQAFVGCVLGIDEIGLTMITFGGIDAISSLGVGTLGNYVRRLPLFLFAGSLNTGMLILMLLWNPVHWSRAIFYVVPGLWGVADGIWQTKTAAMLGILFKEKMEPTWASYLLWQAMGTALGFVGSRFLCVGIKIYIMLAMLAISVIFYIIMEIWQRRRQLIESSGSFMVIN